MTSRVYKVLAKMIDRRPRREGPIKRQRCKGAAISCVSSYDSSKLFLTFPPTSLPISLPKKRNNGKVAFIARGERHANKLICLRRRRCFQRGNETATHPEFVSEISINMVRVDRLLSITWPNEFANTDARKVNVSCLAVEVECLSLRLPAIDTPCRSRYILSGRCLRSDLIAATTFN